MSVRRPKRSAPVIAPARYALALAPICDSVRPSVPFDRSALPIAPTSVTSSPSSIQVMPSAIDDPPVPARPGEAVEARGDVGREAGAAGEGSRVRHPKTLNRRSRFGYEIGDGDLAQSRGPPAPPRFARSLPGLAGAKSCFARPETRTAELSVCRDFAKRSRSPKATRGEAPSEARRGTARPRKTKAKSRRS